MKSLSLISLFLCLFQVVNSLKVDVHLYGIVRCNDNNHGTVSVSLMEEDWRHAPIVYRKLVKDDLIASGNFPLNNSFELHGSSEEKIEIEPYVIVQTQCKGVDYDHRFNFEDVFQKEVWYIAEFKIIDDYEMIMSLNTTFSHPEYLKIE